MSTITRKIPTVARLFLGLVYFVFGLNGFLHFLPMPPLEGTAGTVLGAFVASGYLLTFVKATEVVVGLALLGNRFVPLALVVGAPVTLNIVAFHLFLAPEGMAMPILLLAAHLGLGWAYRSTFRPILAAHATVDEAPSSGRAPERAPAAA